MKLTNRVKLAYKAFTIDNTTGNSLGTVLRNYAKPSEFNPQAQLKGITYKAVELIASAVSVYEPRVVNKQHDVIENHPLLNLFNQPNERQNATDFLSLWSFYYEIYGETFWYQARGEATNKVKELYLINPAQVELIIAEGELMGYKLHKNNGSFVFFELDEIIHDKRPNPFNEWRGMSVMERASDYINIEITTSTFTLNYMRNNASPSGIVTLPNMTKETFQQFAQQWREGYEGPENAGKTAFVRQGMSGDKVDFKAVGATLQDVDQEITRKMSKEDVCLMFGVPQGLMGISGAKGLGTNEIEPLEYIFAKYNTEPRMKRLDRIFETIIAKGGLRDTEQKDVTHNSPIPEDKKFKLETLKAGVNIWITVNEAREQQGLEPIEGGEVLMPRNVVQVEPETKSIKRIQLKKDSKDEKAEAEKFRKKSTETNEIYAVKTQRAISKFARAQEYNVINKISASHKDFEEWLFNVKSESEALAEIINPIMLELVEAQAKDAKNFISGEVYEFSTKNREILSQRILQISGNYNTDTLVALQNTLAEGMKDGESLAKLKKRIEKEYSGAKGYRAERIARSESARTGNATVEDVYKQNGYTSVEWYINPNACEFCASFEGKSKTIGSSFNKLGDVITGNDGGQLEIQYSDIDTPPLHPNCTCSLIPSYN